MTQHSDESKAPVRFPVRGDTVVIPKGAYITGTHSSCPKKAGRTYRVKVYGYHRFNGEVWWPGQGGYWCETQDWRWPESHSDRFPAGDA